MPRGAPASRVKMHSKTVGDERGIGRAPSHNAEGRYWGKKEGRSGKG